LSDPDGPPLDAERIVEVLERHGVEFVLVGGMGAQLHGATRETRDLDLCPLWESKNLDRLAAALRELDARLRDAPADVVFPPITARTLREIRLGTWRTSAGDLDVLEDIPSGDRQHPNRYEDLLGRAVPRDYVGCTISVADLGDIIVSKEAADRPKDREALPELRALRAAQLAGAAYPERLDEPGRPNDPSAQTEDPGRRRDDSPEPPNHTLG
jgi:hypothetical protein